MNLSKDGISTHMIKSYALQMTTAVLSITAPVAFACGLILTPLFSNYQVLIIVSIGIGFVLTNYFFMKKALSAFANDVARRGITEELSSSRPR